MKATDKSNSEEYKNYRLSVKNRLNAPFQVANSLTHTLGINILFFVQKEKKDLEKLRRFVGNNELAHVSTKLSNEERMVKLQEAYKQLEQDYQVVIEKLSTL